MMLRDLAVLVPDEVLGFGFRRFSAAHFDSLSLLQTMINALLSADADAVVGAEWGKPSPTGSRNGYRHLDLDTRVGTIDVAAPKLRQGIAPSCEHTLCAVIISKHCDHGDSAAPD